MMYAIVGVVLLITVLALTCGDSDVPGAFANSAANAKDPSLLDAILSAMQYGCFQSTIVFNVMSVSDVVKDKKEARKAIGAGYLITILLMVCLIFTLFSYTNVFDVCAETLPVMSVLNRLGIKWLQWLYVILMTLAVLTSAAGLAHAGNVRFDGLFRFIKNAQLRRFVITAILLGIAAVGAALGFQAMLQQGTSIVGWAAIPIVVIPPSPSSPPRCEKPNDPSNPPGPAGRVFIAAYLMPSPHRESHWSAFPKASPPRGGGSAKPRLRGCRKYAATSQSPSVTAPPSRGAFPREGKIHLDFHCAFY